MRLGSARALYESARLCLFFFASVHSLAALSYRIHPNPHPHPYLSVSSTQLSHLPSSSPSSPFIIVTIIIIISSLASTTTCIACYTLFSFFFCMSSIGDLPSLLRSLERMILNPNTVYTTPLDSTRLFFFCCMTSFVLALLDCYCYLFVESLALHMYICT